jgi:hypothetical protein
MAYTFGASNGGVAAIAINYFLGRLQEAELLA